MLLIIYIAIILLFVVLLLWTWNNVKDFENMRQKISFIVIGLIVLWITTLILFNISKGGVQYTNEEILGQIRKIALLVFIPINGLISLPHIARIYTNFQDGTDEKKIKRKIIILGIVIVIAIIIEISYLKNFQNGIIQILNSK